MSSPEAGGFFKSDILSPPASVQSSNATSALPHPRAQPLKTGGSKESAFIRYADHGILQIKRRFAKRDSRAPATGDAKGYESFREAGKDMERLIDVVWVSGTRKLSYRNSETPAKY